MNNSIRNSLFTLAFLVLGSWVQSAQAYELAVTAGLRTTDVEPLRSSDSIDNKTGLMLGILGNVEFDAPLYLRTGAIIAERNFHLTRSGTTNKYNFTYLDIPANILYEFSERISAYGGLLLGLKVRDNCKQGSSTCSISNSKTLIYSFNLGGRALFTPNFGMELEYSVGISEMFGNSSEGGVEKPSGVGVGLVYLF